MQDIELEGMGSGSSGPVGQSEEADAEARDQQQDQIESEDGGRDQQVDELETALVEAMERIAELEKQLADASTSQELERQLVEAGVLDLETATVLAERRLAASDATIGEVVSDLVSSKSFLFKATRRGPAGSAVSGGPSAARDSLSELAEEAMQTGDRRAVLRYLKRRRG